MLATTDPQKLLATIRTRCAEFKVGPLSPKDSLALLGTVCEKEKIDITEDVADCLIKHGDGSPRKLLVLLDGIRHLDGEEDQLESIRNSESKREAIELARLLIRPGSTWNDIRPVLLKITEEPESLRWMVLGYANSILMKGGKLAPNAYLIIEAFRENFYDSKKAGLTAACWEIIHP